MPVINWDAGDAPVINKGFKYYWIVTLPLTLLILVFWGSAMLLQWRDSKSRLHRSSRTREFGMELMETDP
jgi:hypothetical protein